MDQSPLAASPSPENDSSLAGLPAPLPFLCADEAETDREEPFVVVTRDPLEFCRWLVAEAPGLQWIQAENVLSESEAWAMAARKGNDVPVDVIVADPASDFAALYRLVDVNKVRSVRVSIPVVPGFLKSLRLAASIQIPVRLLPGQPGEDVLEELEEALTFYLHDPMVEAPVEFFHSALMAAGGDESASLWVSCEHDPEVFSRKRTSGEEVSAIGSVAEHLARLEQEKAECVTCSWKDYCFGYFKQPGSDYSCTGILHLLERIGKAAYEMNQDLRDFGSEISAYPQAKSLPVPES